MGKLPPAVIGLLIANAIFFVPSHLLSDAAGNRMLAWFALFYPSNPFFNPWQFVSYMFMHGSPTHILFNMFALASFGPYLERILGLRRFLLFYFICGVGAALVQTGVNWMEFRSIQRHLIDAGLSEASVHRALLSWPVSQLAFSGPTHRWFLELHDVFNSNMVGASGAVYGVLVAFGLLFPNARLALMFLPVPIPAKFLIPVILSLDLLGGLTGFSIFGGSIAHFAHLGGAAIGFLLMWYWRSNARTRQTTFRDT